MKSNKVIDENLESDPMTEERDSTSLTRHLSAPPAPTQAVERQVSKSLLFMRYLGNTEDEEEIEGIEKVEDLQPDILQEEAQPLHRGFLHYCVRFTLMLLILGIGALFHACFSLGWLGWGDVLYKALVSTSDTLFMPLLIGNFALLLLVVLLDIGSWRGRVMQIFSKLFIFLFVIGIIATTLTSIKYFPAAFLAIFLVLAPLVILGFKIVMLKSLTYQTFLLWTSVSLFIVAGISSITFIFWVNETDHWFENPITKQEFFNRLNCTLTTTGSTNDTNTILANKCDDEAFLLWLSPIILCLFCLYLASVFLLIRRTRRRKKLDRYGKFLIFFLIGSLFTIWLACELSGGEISIASQVFVLAILGLFTSVGATVLIFGSEEIKNPIKNSSILHRFQESLHSEWVISLGFLLFWPTLFFLVPLSIIRQFGRKCLPFTKRFESEEESRLLLSKELHDFIQWSYYSWNWTSILVKAMYWGIAFDLVHVCLSLALDVFFSWLNDSFVASGFGVPEVLGIFILLTFALMMLPPTPGMPIFLASGIIVVQTCYNRFGWDFWLASILAILVALLVKLLSVFFCQLLGYCWGERSLRIKSIINVNSIELKAIRFILEEKGISKAKVAIMIGGPDWPISVIAGILKTSFIGNLIATLPILVFIVPTVLCGACLLREGGLWATISSLMFSASVFLQTISMFYAMHYIDKVIRKNRAELDQYPHDMEVEAHQQEEHKRYEVRERASKFENLPTWMKSLLIIGFFSIAFSVYVFGMLSSECFRKFHITDSIKNLPDGKLINLILPAGWFGIALFSITCVILIVLGRWISCFGVHRLSRETPGMPITREVVHFEETGIQMT